MIFTKMYLQRLTDNFKELYVCFAQTFHMAWWAAAAIKGGDLACRLGLVAGVAVGAVAVGASGNVGRGRRGKLSQFLVYLS